MSTLTFERGPGRRSYVRYLRDLARVRGFVDTLDLRDDVAVREEMGYLLATILVYRHHVDRCVDETLASGDSLAGRFDKLYWSEMQAQLFDFGRRVLGAHGEFVEDPPDLPGAREFRDDYWYARASRLVGGTNEIQKNVIAERLLGMPRGAGR
jgi:alkylation response protein AidB-like acyl-CoA dehydrogenase